MLFAIINSFSCSFLFWQVLSSFPKWADQSYFKGICPHQLLLFSSPLPPRKVPPTVSARPLSLRQLLEKVLQLMQNCPDSYRQKSVSNDLFEPRFLDVLRKVFMWERNEEDLRLIDSLKKRKEVMRCGNGQCILELCSTIFCFQFHNAHTDRTCIRQR